MARRSFVRLRAHSLTSKHWESVGRDLLCAGVCSSFSFSPPLWYCECNSFTLCSYCVCALCMLLTFFFAVPLLYSTSLFRHFSLLIPSAASNQFNSVSYLINTKPKRLVQVVPQVFSFFHLSCHREFNQMMVFYVHCLPDSKPKQQNSKSMEKNKTPLTHILVRCIFRCVRLSLISLIYIHNIENMQNVHEVFRF